MITYYEEKLLIRDVDLADFERRVKSFVYGSDVVKLRQLKKAFSGDTNLETIINDKEHLDW